MIHVNTFSPDGQCLVLASDDRSVRVWDAASGKPLGEPLPHDGDITSAGFCLDGTRIYTTCSDGLLRFGDGQRGQALPEPIKHPKGIAGAGATGNVISTWCDDFNARLWAIDSGKPMGEPMPHTAAIHGAAFGLSGKLLLTFSADKTARLWDGNSSKPFGVVMAHPAAVLAGGFGAGDDVVWTLADDGLVRLWQTRSQKSIGNAIKHEGLTSAAMHVKSKLLLTGGKDKTARLWDVGSNVQAGEPLAHDGAVLQVSLGGSDGNLILSRDDAGLVRVWAADTRQPVGEPLQHKKAVQDASFDSSGERVLTIGADRVARLWDTLNGRLIGQPIQIGVATAPSTPATTNLGGLALTQLGNQSVVVVAGITGVFTPLTTGAGRPLGDDERKNLLQIIEQLKREVSEVQSRNLKLESDLATLRERPLAADDFAGGVQQSLDELQQRMANMRNTTSNFAVREFKLEASVFVQVTPLGSVEYRFVQPGEEAPPQALSKLSLQVVPVPKDSLAGVFSTNLFQPEVPVAALPEVSADAARKIESAGVFTLGEFLQVGTRARAQAYLSALLGVERQRLALWAQQALLMTLRGVNGASALVLIEAGVSSFEILSGLTSAGLVSLYDAARSRRPDLAAPVLTPAMAAQWIRAARQYLGLTDTEPADAPPAPPP
jgi:WD40 repeat protein